MNKNIIYTVGYTLFQKGNVIDIDALFNTLQSFGVQYLIDVRSVPYSKQYPQCNADCMKTAGRNYGIVYANMPEIGAKAKNTQDVFSKASDIFFEDIFPIAKSNRPEKTELAEYEDIVDFQKFRRDDYFTDGIKRIENAYDKDCTLCLMCSESKPMDCHRYFLISKVLESKYGEWLDVKHIIKNPNGDISDISNTELDNQLKDFILHKDVIRKLDILNQPLFGTSRLENYFGETQDDKVKDFCDRYWNLMHGWKKQGNIKYNEDYD
jgi:hypothetical protein